MTEFSHDYEHLQDGAHAAELRQSMVNIEFCYQKLGGFYPRLLHPDMLAEIEITADKINGIQIEQDRMIVVRSLQKESDKLQVVYDSAQHDSWKGELICLGSICQPTSSIKQQARPNFVTPLGSVMIDTRAKLFEDLTCVSYLAAQYNRVNVQGVKLF